MQSFNRDRQLRPFKWGVKFGAVVAIWYILVLLMTYFGYMDIQSSKISIIYPGFSTDPVGIAIGFVWMSLEAFAIGYIAGMLYLIWFEHKEKYRSDKA